MSLDGRSPLGGRIILHLKDNSTQSLNSLFTTGQASTSLNAATPGPSNAVNTTTVLPGSGSTTSTSESAAQLGITAHGIIPEPTLTSLHPQHYNAQTSDVSSTVPHSSITDTSSILSATATSHIGSSPSRSERYRPLPRIEPHSELHSPNSDSSRAAAQRQPLPNIPHANIEGQVQPIREQTRRLLVDDMLSSNTNVTHYESEIGRAHV